MINMSDFAYCLMLIYKTIGRNIENKQATFCHENSVYLLFKFNCDERNSVYLMKLIAVPEINQY